MTQYGLVDSSEVPAQPMAFIFSVYVTMFPDPTHYTVSKSW